MVDNRVRGVATRKGEVAAEDSRLRLARDVPPGLTAVTPSYVRHVWLATLSVSLLIAAYLALSAWFVYVSWRLALGLAEAAPPRWDFFSALFMSGVMAALLLSGLLSIRRGSAKDGLELTAKQQPELFAFLHQLADAAGAPRPERVFVSARVNAAVFYDLSLLNLFVPTRKELELGLGLVNTLTRSELAAVIAHEFGHFTQRSMALGRWVYLSRRIVERVLVQRSQLEQVLVQLSWSRLFWLAWLPRLLIWSVRSLLGLGLHWAERLQRALGREMEFQADLVAVSLTGSDALVHALHRLGPADEAWTLAAEVALQQIRAGRAVPDLFALQDRVIKRTGVILNDTTHGASPTLPKAGRAEHRVFQAKLADAPSMWSSHPANRDREDNAKQRYVAAELDARSAWGLFRDPDALKQQVTQRFLAPHSRASMPALLSLEAALDALSARLDRPCLSARYRAAYFGRSPVLHLRSAKELYGPLPRLEEVPGRLASLYPVSLGSELRALHDKVAERDRLRTHLKELNQGMSAVQFQGRAIGRSGLHKLLKRAEREERELRKRIEQHDRECRTVHLAIARARGEDWAAYLTNLATTLIYAAHSHHALECFWGDVERALALHTEGGRWLTRNSVAEIEQSSLPLQQLLAELFEQRHELKLTPDLRAKLLGPGLTGDSRSEDAWTRMLPKALPELPQLARDPQGFATWFEGLGRSVAMLSGALEVLEDAALDSLLEVEAQLRHAYESKIALGPAPLPSSLPATYTKIIAARESAADSIRWWARPFISDARPFRLLRLTAAALVFCALSSFTVAPREAFEFKAQLQAQLSSSASLNLPEWSQTRFYVIGTKVYELLADKLTSPASTEARPYEPYVPSRETARKLEVEERARLLAKEKSKTLTDSFDRPRSTATEQQTLNRILVGDLPLLPPGKYYRPVRGNDGTQRFVIVDQNELQPGDTRDPSAAVLLASAPNAELHELTLAQSVENYPPGEKKSSEWLQLAINEKRDDLLRRRLQRYPDDPATLAALAALKPAR